MNEIINDLRSMSINDVCDKYDMSFTQLFNTLKKHNRSNKSRMELSKYIYLRNNRYWVQKKNKGLIQNYGSYINFEDANRVKNELVRLNWEVDPLDYLGDKWIVSNCGGYSINRRDETGKLVHYGRWKSLSFTRKVRDCLVKFNWDKDYLPLILEKLRGEMR